MLKWMPPEGTICCYRVQVQQEKESNLIFNKTLFGISLIMDNLTAGTEFELNVSALAGLMPNDSVEGEAITIMSTTGEFCFKHEYKLMVRETDSWIQRQANREIQN